MEIPFYQNFKFFNTGLGKYLDWSPKQPLFGGIFRIVIWHIFSKIEKLSDIKQPLHTYCHLRFSRFWPSATCRQNDQLDFDNRQLNKSKQKFFATWLKSHVTAMKDWYFFISLVKNRVNVNFGTVFTLKIHHKSWNYINFVLETVWVRG